MDSESYYLSPSFLIHRVQEIILTLHVVSCVCVCVCVCVKFIYSFSAVLSLRCCAGFSLVVASRGTLWSQCMGFSLQWLVFLWSEGSGAHGLHSVVVAQSLVVAVARL